MNPNIFFFFGIMLYLYASEYSNRSNTTCNTPIAYGFFAWISTLLIRFNTTILICSIFYFNSEIFSDSFFLSNYNYNNFVVNLLLFFYACSLSNTYSTVWLSLPAPLKNIPDNYCYLGEHILSSFSPFL